MCPYRDGKELWRTLGVLATILKGKKMNEFKDAVKLSSCTFQLEHHLFVS